MTDDLGYRSLPSDQVAIRVVVQKTRPLLFFCSVSKQLHDELVHNNDVVAALDEFRMLVGQARTRSRATAGHSNKPRCQPRRGGDRYEGMSQETSGYTCAML